MAGFSWALGTFGMVMFAVPSSAWGACPAPGPICAEYARATLVFIADVETVRPSTIMQVRFRIVESLKGASDAQTTMTFEPSSEELSYVKGQRVLVYAHRSGGLWSTACTRTKVLSPADTETSALRA